jgi:alkylation response protein AidB-like acyl-CoA dehydrogenase
MDLTLTDEQRALREATRRVLADRLGMLVAQLPSPPRHDAAQALRDAQQLGWLGLGLPESVGGAGTFEDLVLVHEELGRGLAGSLVTTLTVAGRYLLHAQAGDELLSGLASGTVLAAVARGAVGTEPRVSGRLAPVLDADTVGELLVLAGDALVRVPLDGPGVAVAEQESACDLRQWAVTLSDVAVAEVLPGEAGAAVHEEVVLAAARAVGGGRAVLERTVQHVSTRHQFDRPIGTFQAVQHQLADVATALDGAGLAVARAAQAPATDTAAVAVAGAAAAEAFRTATLVAHQLHGGMGFVLDSPLHLWSARAVADPTVPAGRRELLDRLAPSALAVPPHHRAAV